MPQNLFQNQITTDLQEKISQFPITPYLGQICSELKKSQSRFMVLTAETAAGKSTILPLSLLQAFDGKILMTEPRRLAVLGVANRVSDLLDEKCGESVGYKIHLENKVSNKTKLEVVTEAILVRMLQSDPALEDYNVVVLDEFHERSINLDLALAFLKEAMELRDDLYVIIMSATIDTEKIRDYLAKEKQELPPLIEVPGRQFDVDVIYRPEVTVENAVEQELENTKGNILVFLPGIKEIRKAEENIRQQNWSNSIELCVLHSSISLEEQKKVIRQMKENDLQRVILSSAIAETSLTVPGVTCVIDTGVSRVNRINISTGMESLSTEVESEFSAEQRKGRAGRLQNGRCIRLWSKFDPRNKLFEPEILRTDLTTLVLECCERGVFTANGIDWLDKPVTAAWSESLKLLHRLGLIKSDCRITSLGKATLKLGIHPRLAAIALISFWEHTKKGLVELGKAKDLILKYSTYSKASKDIQTNFIKDLTHRCKECFENKELQTELQELTVENIPLILYGYPDRIACRVSGVAVEPAEYQFAGGRKALYYKNPCPQWIVAPEVLAGQKEGVIFEFEPVSENLVLAYVQQFCEIKEKCFFGDGKVQKVKEVCYGQIVLSSQKLKVEPQDFAAAWVNEVLTKGIEVLPCDSKDDRIEKLITRVCFYNQQNKKCENGCSIAEVKLKLQESVEQWLTPFMNGITKLTEQIVYDALYWYLNGAEIDKEVPEQIVLANGRRCKVKYEKQNEIKPVIEIIIQRIFGCFETPQICGKKVLLKLLSPASRPLQVTEDLEGFWTGAWPEICKEMKGRYPKHNWDYKITEKD